MDSDGAQDLLDRMEPLTPLERHESVEHLIQAAQAPVAEWPKDLWDVEVVAAIAVLVANVTGESQDEDQPAMPTWLPQPVPRHLVRQALAALTQITATDSSWDRSWASDADRAEARASHQQLAQVLREAVAE